MALKKGPKLAAITPMKAAPGRPATNTQKFAVKPIGPNRSKTGFEMVNTTPEAIQMAKDHDLSQGVLPPALAPEVQRVAKAKAISKGEIGHTPQGAGPSRWFLTPKRRWVRCRRQSTIHASRASDASCARARWTNCRSCGTSFAAT